MVDTWLGLKNYFLTPYFWASVVIAVGAGMVWLFKWSDWEVKDERRRLIRGWRD